MVTDAKKSKIYDMHNIIQTTIGQIQDKTQQILQDQERDLIRAFRIRLAQVQEDLEKERKKNESGSAEWVVRCHKLTEELEWLRELADKLTTENNLFLQENKKHARQLASQEQDRAFLLKQLVGAKKENARLRLLLESGAPGTEADHIAMMTGAKHTPVPALEASASPRGPRALSRQSTASASATPRLRMDTNNNNSNNNNSNNGSASQAALIEQLQAHAARSTREREALQAQLHQARAHAARLEARCRKLETTLTQTEVERSDLRVFFRQAVDDVRADILARRIAKTKLVQGKAALAKGFLTTTLPRNATASASASASALASASGPVSARASTSPRDTTSASAPLSPPVDPRSVPLSSFTVQDRVHVMEWLLTQDHVVRHLYDQLFPAPGAGAGAGAGAGEGSVVWQGMGQGTPRGLASSGSGRGAIPRNHTARAAAHGHAPGHAPTGFSRGPAAGARFSLRRPATTPLGAGVGAGKGKGAGSGVGAGGLLNSLSPSRGRGAGAGAGAGDEVDPMQVLQVMIQEAPALEALAGEAEAEAEAEARGEAEAEAGGERKGKQYAMTAHIPSRRPLPVPGTEVEDGEDEERLRAMMEEDFENF
jgi:hypothetical protein